MSTIQSPESLYTDSFVRPGNTQTGSLTDRKTGLVNHNLTTAVALAEVLWPAIDAGLGTPGNADFVWLTFSSAGDFYIITGETPVAVPDPAAHTGLNPTQQCRLIPANFEYMRKFERRPAPIYYRLIQNSGSDLLVNVEMTSGPRFDI